jgi:FAD/FMN-containing dehydrogenase
VDRPDTIINLAGYVWASLGVRGPTWHDPLATPDRAGTVLIRVGSSRARTGTARSFGHLYMHAKSPLSAYKNAWVPLCMHDMQKCTT